jgi:hypothetical protein
MFYVFLLLLAHLLLQVGATEVPSPSPSLDPSTSPSSSPATSNSPTTTHSPSHVVDEVISDWSEIPGEGIMPYVLGIGGALFLTMLFALGRPTREQPKPTSKSEGASQQPRTLVTTGVGSDQTINNSTISSDDGDVNGDVNTISSIVSTQSVLVMNQADTGIIQEFLNERPGGIPPPRS